MKNLNKILILSLMLNSMHSLFAASITAELDHTIIELGDQVQLSVHVEGDLDEEITLPEIPDVEVRFIGPQTQFSIINGKTSKKVSLIYALLPGKIGSFRIPEIAAKIDGNSYKTVPLKFKVMGAGERRANGEKPPVFIEREFAKTELWVGEPTVARIKIYHRVQLRQPQVDPATPSKVKRFQVQGQRETQTLIDGMRYNVIEISEVLIPLNPETIELPPYRVTVLIPDGQSQNNNRRRQTPFDMFDDFFNDPFARGRMVQRTFSSPAAKLTVKNLPPAPKGFSGLVGDYNLSANLNKRSVAVGDTVTLTLSLKGTGNLEGSQIFENLQIPGTKIYPDQPEVLVNPDIDEGIQSEGTYKFALVPNAPGEIALGALSLVVFNSKLGKYVTLSVDVGTLSVTGSAQTATVSSGDYQEQKRRVQTLSDDLLGLHRGTRLLGDHELRASDVLFSMGLCCLPLFVGLYGWWRRRFLFDKEFVKQKKRSRAYSTAKNTIDAASINELEAGLKQAVAGIQEYFALKFGIKGEALTIKDFAKVLDSHQVKRVNMAPIENVFNLYNQIEYGQPDLTSLRQSEWREDVLTTLAAIDREVK